MRKTLLSLTAACALGALAIPTAGFAASSSGITGSVNAGSPAKGSAGAGVSAHTSGATINSTAHVNSNAKSWNGQQSWNGNWDRHHRHHRDFRFVPFAAYGDYAAYDYCWQTVWTPAGFKRIFVCGNDYNYY